MDTKKIDKIDNAKFENCSDRNLFSDNFLVIWDALLIYCNLLFTVYFVR